MQLLIYGPVKTGLVKRQKKVYSDEYNRHRHIFVYGGCVNAVYCAMYHLMHTTFNKNDINQE